MWTTCRSSPATIWSGSRWSGRSCASSARSSSTTAAAPRPARRLSESAAQVAAEGRRILIYPEGNLAKPGERFRYRTGVYYMSRDFNLPVVPVATNLGLFWEQTSKIKRPGVATIEFLDPIETGLDRTPFLDRLETVIETRSQELIALATGEPVRPSVLVPTPDEVRKGVVVAEAAA
jgi:1-acyl-sn-glycerol-3-phosphate acyltransferase